MGRNQGHVFSLREIQVKHSTQINNDLKNTNLKEAGRPREAKCERLAADIEGLGVRLLRADREGVSSSGSGTPPRQPEQRVGADRHGRVRRVVQMENSQAQRRQPDHEGSLGTRVEEQLDTCK